MRKFLLFYLILFFMFGILHQSVNAENIHFNDSVYNLKYTDTAKEKTMVENEYFKANENKDYWTSMVGIYYYPEVSNPLKFAHDRDEEIESKENFVLLKFIQNKKQDVALISFLENGIQQNQTFFIYNIYKYEKHPKKGMMVLRYAKKYVFNTNDEITKIAQEVKAINNDLMEQLIISPIPPIVEHNLP